MYNNPILTKVPGDILCGNKKEKQGYIQDISKLNKSELLDLKRRQELLLRNKKQISKLPDKGLKIENFYKQILKQLKVYENVDRAAEMFSELNIVVGKKSLANMEWSGKHNAQHHTDIVDSDDEIDDQNIGPLKILARSTNVGKIITSKSEKALITRQDLEDIEVKREKAECITTADLFEIDSGSQIMDRLSTQSDSKHLHMMSKTKFLPFRTTKSNVHDPEKEKHRYKGHLKWENTSATPPSLTHSPAKVLSLEESVQLQEEKNNLLQQAQERYTEERLLQRQEIKDKVTSSIYSDLMQGSTGLTTSRDVSDSEGEIQDDVEYDSETQDS
ncbi:DNA-directed RNA polymerase II subunit GRINL1A [Ochlerotatus camptorhynchus]|uniref:DNA-directed RNA polymerase II subunit GRINL1A n=1 Tax=Ochlerotatus camptorhynchus TaxID=644619 RepID=UPI0031E06F5D